MERIEIIAYMEIPGGNFCIFDGHPDVLPIHSLAHFETHNEFRAVFFDTRQFDDELKVDIQRSMPFTMVLN